MPAELDSRLARSARAGGARVLAASRPEAVVTETLAEGLPSVARVHRLSNAPHAVLLFAHGFAVDVRFYDDLLRGLAARGFTVVAPQLHAPGLRLKRGSSADDAVVLGRWAEALGRDRASLVPGAGGGPCHFFGHSRGGKAILRHLLAAPPADDTRVVLFDPVDGGFEAPMLEGHERLAVPALVFGTELGPKPILPRFPPAVFAGEGPDKIQRAFSDVRRSELEGSGHMDILDARVPRGHFTRLFVPGGQAPERTQKRVIEETSRFLSRPDCAPRSS